MMIAGAIALPFSASAAPMHSDYARQTMIPPAMRIDLNGFRHVCQNTDEQADCVYRHVRQKLDLMHMADRSCPVAIEARAVSDIFNRLLKIRPTDTQLVEAHDTINAIYGDIRLACTVMSAS